MSPSFEQVRELISVLIHILIFSSLQVVIYLGLWEAIRYMVRNMITFWEILIKLTRFREETLLENIINKVGNIVVFF